MRVHVHDLVAEQARLRGASAALSYQDATVDYDRLWSDVQAVGAGLQDVGVGRGDRVAIYLEKRIETVTSIFATSVAGGLFVPVNPVLKPEQASFVLLDCEVRVLVTSPQRWALLADLLGDAQSLVAVVLVGEADGREVDGVQLARYDELAGSARTPVPVDGVDLDPAAILYTSGSTGRPKGVVLSHRNLLVGAESVSGYLGNVPDDVVLAALPISFDAGLSQLTTAFWVGAHVVLMNYLFPAEVPRLCALHGVTGLTCVPPLWIQVAEAAWPEQARERLRYFANTGGRLPKATLDQLRELFPQAAPYLMYGLTEAFRSTYLDPAEVDRRPDSIGRAIPNAEVLVVRPDGSRCGPGEEGELVHRGPLVALGYWNDPEQTALRFRPAPGSQPTWRPAEIAVWSGDTVRTDEEGFLYFVGRQDDMIKTSGYRVSPTEVEEVAYESGLVRDAVAVGVADDRLGQRIVVVVTPAQPDAFDAVDLLSAYRRALPSFMVPSAVEIRPKLPQSPNGKFDRGAVREELAG
ncbi:acyl-CoA ligase (AMP-forming), exosortase A system-associated [Nocardioides sp. T2.26MG-1]|uniref:acyl-CoA ligase (AMP-forming), exosortase A system-associated n=1 Tax=Nocardioides sp. T2.26MG-1 TaxID=3041166 RepID=UPI002477907F|nr:acyl-CoA ligase (AMP-forming), exosortase A system-associated [Nocardioides sp. T2.26MG-1]CAI9398639.1 Long-chain-fatty-acid--CoA ligase [Nocardioides sp. T2.26MG-1]